jgi:class 3 adenylate cyclase
LRRLGLEKYAPAFDENAINWDVLSELTTDDLKEIGVVAVGDRRRLLAAIAALGEGALPAAAVSDVSAPTEAKRRQLTVMFCDLVGSTPLSTRFDPEDLHEIVGTYHRCVTDTVGRFGGFVAKYMGDGVRVPWGVVAEVVPNGKAVARARELADLYLQVPEVTHRNTRIHFIQPLKERIVREVGYGLSLEGASSADLVKSKQSKS